MTTLIILVILFAIAIIGLIIISIKKFSDKTDYILTAISLLTTKLNDIEKFQQNNFSNIISDIDKGFKGQASNITNLLSAIGSANKTIMNLINDSNKDIIKLFKSINIIEEKNTSILNKTVKIDSRFITLHETIKDNLNNIEIAIKSLVNSINAVEEKLSTVPNSEDIIDSNELVNRIANGLYDKMNDLQAKNSLPTNKVGKPSSTKSKHRTRAKKVDNSYNSVQDAPKQNVSEN